MSTFVKSLPFRFTFPAKTPWVMLVLLCLCCPRVSPAAEARSASANLSAAQIVERHVAARGGAQAWKSLQTLSIAGKMDAGAGDSAARSERIARLGTGATVRHAPPAPGKESAARQVQLPFTLEMKRPNKSRLEIQFAGQTAVQVFDGTSGWKLRPFLNRNDAEPFTAEELKSEADHSDLEDPLVDALAKGSKVELAGIEPVEGHQAYKLKLTTRSGNVQNIWIDAHSFLDVKVQGAPRRFDGRMREVWVYQRDFRTVGGLNIPHEYETAVEGVPGTHKVLFESVKVNGSLDDARFTRPQPAAAEGATATARPLGSVAPVTSK